MNQTEVYSNDINSLIKNNNPEAVRKNIQLSLTFAEQRSERFPKVNVPTSLQYLNQICLTYILEPFRYPDNYAWVNLFAPVEILHAMDIYPLDVEAFSSFTSALRCHDGFIDYAEKSGIAETLCGYHKAFIGAVESKVLLKPKFALTSTMVCDANVNTFRYVSHRYEVPCLIIDVPYEYSIDAEKYVEEQIKEAIKAIEGFTGKVFNEDRLKEVLKIENSSKEYMHRYLKGLCNKYMPSALTLQMYMLFTSHTFIGRKETLKFYEALSKDIEKSSYEEGLKVLWVNVIPFYSEVLKEYFNYNNKYQLVTYDMPFDDMEYMDYNHPYRAIAKKMLNNKLNGKFERKIELITDMIDKIKPDAVINFCQWGCRQSSGGVMLLKEALKAKNIPFLSIDGDGVDRRSEHQGQLRTRLEAFFEIINNGG